MSSVVYMVRYVLEGNAIIATEILTNQYHNCVGSVIGLLTYSHRLKFRYDLLLMMSHNVH